MKFNCGLSPEKKFKQNCKAWKELAATKVSSLRLGNKWFAWYPVRLADYDCRWLEFVHRSYPLANMFCSPYTKYGYYVSVGSPVYTAIKGN